MNKILDFLRVFLLCALFGAALPAAASADKAPDVLVRDAVALPADMMGNEPFSIDHVPTRNTVLGTRVVHGRSVLLGADRTLKEAALDRYAFVRDFYLEQRRYKVSDGQQAREYEDFDDQSAAPLGDEVDTAAAAAVERLELVAIGELAFDHATASPNHRN